MAWAQASKAYALLLLGERDMASQRAELAARPKDAPLNLGTVD